MARIAYLFPAFPVFHQTFVLWEVLGLQHNGVRPIIYSLWPGTAQQQPEGREIASYVNYLPPVCSRPVWRAVGRMMRHTPARLFQLYVEVIRAWRTGAATTLQEGAAPRSCVTAYNRFRGWLNSNPFPYLMKSLWLVPTAVYLSEQLQRDKVTHLHVHWATYPATVAYVVHLISGLPFSISAHAYDIYMTQRMLPAKLRAARFAVTCAKTNQRFLQRVAGPELGAKVRVNYHGVDIGRFAPAVTEIKPAGQLTIGSCGQLERYKGMHLLIEACAQLAQAGIAIECWIVGEGPEQANLERQIQAQGLGQQVRLCGALPHAQLAERLRKADAFVLASELAGKSRRRDVIANVIVEAMAVGLPVVAARIPGVEELIDDGVTGYLVPPNSAEPLTEAIRKLAQHPEDRVRFGRAARRRILQDFDSSKNVRVLAEMLMSVADAEPSLDSTAVGRVA